MIETITIDVIWQRAVDGPTVAAGGHMLSHTFDVHRVYREIENTSSQFAEMDPCGIPQVMRVLHTIPSHDVENLCN